MVIDIFCRILVVKGRYFWSLGFRNLWTCVSFGGNWGIISETTSGPRHRPSHRGVVLRDAYFVCRCLRFVGCNAHSPFD